MTKASELERNLGVTKAVSSNPALYGDRVLVVSFDSHRPKAMFSCF